MIQRVNNTGTYQLNISVVRYNTSSTKSLTIHYARLITQFYNSIHVIVVTWARGICLICMPEARGLRAYISGKSREHMLQVIYVSLLIVGFC